MFEEIQFGMCLGVQKLSGQSAAVRVLGFCTWFDGDQSWRNRLISSVMTSFVILPPGVRVAMRVMLALRSQKLARRMALVL